MITSKFLEKRLVHLPALLLSAAVHSGLWFAAGATSTGRGPVSDPRASATITVELKTSETLLATPLTQAEEQLAESQQADTSSNAMVSAEAAPLLPLMTSPEPHYFRTSQLSQKPLVLRDASADLILVLPELPDDVAILRLFINDGGGIDRVVVEESRLPESAEQRIVDAFSKLSFQPGKIGRVAVRSQLRIEVRTADFSFPRHKLALRNGEESLPGN